MQRPFTIAILAILAGALLELMPETIRQQLVNKLKARLARIQVANGFETDIGLTPAEDNPTRYNEGQLREATHLGIFDDITESVQSFPTEQSIPNSLPMQVRIFHSQKTEPAELRTMIADVLKAIIENETTGKRDPTFDRLAVDTKPTNDGFIRNPDTYAIDAGAVGFNVEFYSQPFNAYA